MALGLQRRSLLGHTHHRLAESDHTGGHTMTEHIEQAHWGAFFKNRLAIFVSPGVSGETIIVPLCRFDYIPYWLQRNTTCKCIKIQYLCRRMEKGVSR
jgi:hypothetical protein